MPTPTVHASAEIDASTAGVLREQLREVIAANPGSVVLVDMAEVEFIDSTGLGVLVSGLKQARLHDGDVAIANTQPTIRRILHITGLDKMFAAVVPN